MKTLRFFGVCLLVSLLCVNFSACDSDDESHNAFVGKWDAKIGMGHDNIFEFSSNGRFVLIYHWDEPTYGHDHICNEEKRLGEYVYKPETKEFLLIFDEGNTWIWYVSNISDNKIILRDSGNSNIYTFTKKQ